MVMHCFVALLDTYIDIDNVSSPYVHLFNYCLLLRNIHTKPKREWKWKRSNINRQTSKKIFAFVFAFTWSVHSFKPSVYLYYIMPCLPWTLSNGSRCNAHTLRPIHTKRESDFSVSCSVWTDPYKNSVTYNLDKRTCKNQTSVLVE